MGSCRSYLTGKTVSLSTLLSAVKHCRVSLVGSLSNPTMHWCWLQAAGVPPNHFLCMIATLLPKFCFQQSIKKRSAEPCRGKFEVGIGQCVRPHHGLQSYDPEVTVALEIHTQSHWGRSHVMQNYTGKTFGPESHIAVAGFMIHQSHSGRSIDSKVTVALEIYTQSHRGRSHDPESQKSWRLTVAGAVAQSHS